MQRRIKAETKMLILREHLENQVSLADLAEKYHVNVNSIINCLPASGQAGKKKLFESAALVFETSREGTTSDQEATDQLEQEIRKKDAVIAQLAEEVIAVKKAPLGAADSHVGGAGHPGPGGGRDGALIGPDRPEDRRHDPMAWHHPEQILRVGQEARRAAQAQRPDASGALVATIRPDLDRVSGAKGKMEPWHGTISQECLRDRNFIDLDDARRQVAAYIDIYNTKRLHSSLNYLTPLEVLQGKSNERIQGREHKLADAAMKRRELRKAA